MTPDRPVLGIILMIGFCVVAPFGDAISKILNQTIPLFELLTIRFAIQAVLLTPIMFLSPRVWTMTRRVLTYTVLRTFLHIAGIGAMVLSLRYLPLADAIAIAFVMPFIMLLLGKYVLREEIGARRLIACIVGFAGTLLVIQPSFAKVGLPALLPLVVALDFALFILVTRQIAKDVDPISLQAVSGILGTLGMIVIFYAFNFLTPIQIPVVSPDTIELSLLLLYGSLGTIAHLLMTWSLKFAPASTLAPMQYLEIPVATIVGYLIFKDFPNGLALLGIAITILAGLYVVHREHYVATLKTSAEISH